MYHGRAFRVGDPVVFCAHKRSSHPGPRARNVWPESYGEGYQYEVDKFWLVHEAQGNRLILRTRRGKLHVVDAEDVRLRRARWWERVLYRGRFPLAERPIAAGQG